MAACYGLLTLYTWQACADEHNNRNIIGCHCLLGIIEINIQIKSTNMPNLGLVICEIDFEILRIFRRGNILYGKTNGRVRSVKIHIS